VLKLLPLRWPAWAGPLGHRVPHLRVRGQLRGQPHQRRPLRGPRGTPAAALPLPMVSQRLHHPRLHSPPLLSPLLPSPSPAPLSSPPLSCPCYCVIGLPLFPALPLASCVPTSTEAPIAPDSPLRSDFAFSPGVWSRDQMASDFAALGRSWGHSVVVPRPRPRPAPAHRHPRLQAGEQVSSIAGEREFRSWGPKV